MNETKLCYCDYCDETISIKSNSKQIKSKTHKHKEKYSSAVKDYEIFKSDIDVLKYLLNDTIKDCRNKYFLSFEYRCLYDKNFTNMENNGQVILKITLENMKFKSQSYGLSKKVKNQ